MSLIARLDNFQRRHPAVGFPLAVIYKFNDDQGSYLAAIITYYAIVSLFPLLYLLTATLGFILHGNEHLQERILDSTLSQFPVIGTQLGDPKGLTGNAAGITFGILVAIYGGLGVAQAAQNAMNVAWAVPRNERPNPLKARVRSLLLIVTVGVGILITTGLSALSGSAEAFGARIGSGLTALVTIAAVALNACLFLIAFRLACAREVPFRDIAPGALLAALLWQVLQLLGTAYVGHVVKNASATSGVFALVLGLLAWMYLSALLSVVCIEFNVVRARRLYPRALLTPFTDHVDLTKADRLAYSAQARAQRFKGFQRVEVRFKRSTDDGTQAGDDDPDRDEGGHA
jgi:membrane protein